MVDQISLGLRSLVKQDGILELSLTQTTVSSPKDDEVIVRVEATPINPSDLWLLLAGGDVHSGKVSGNGSQTVLPRRSPRRCARSPLESGSQCRSVWKAQAS